MHLYSRMQLKGSIGTMLRPPSTPFAYYQESDKLCHFSHIVVSDCMQHDTVAFHVFQRYFITFLKIKMYAYPKKVYYFSNGAATQYKNRKNFINLCYHEIDFGIPAEWAEWHFFCSIT